MYKELPPPQGPGTYNTLQIASILHPFYVDEAVKDQAEPTEIFLRCQLLSHTSLSFVIFVSY